MTKIEKANLIIASIPRIDCRPTIVMKGNRVALSWYSGWYSKNITKVWTAMSEGSHYPSWDTPWGGTFTTAVGQLVRWVRNKPVFGISVWQYWSSEGIGLCNKETIDLLKELGYPDKNICVLCKKECKGLDWWSRDKVTGPCCTFGNCEVRIRDKY